MRHVRRAKLSHGFEERAGWHARRRAHHAPLALKNKAPARRPARGRRAGVCVRPPDGERRGSTAQGTNTSWIALERFAVRVGWHAPAGSRYQAWKYQGWPSVNTPPEAAIGVCSVITPPAVAV